MKLEFLPDGSLDCPLIRLFQFTSVEASRLHIAVARLATGTGGRVEVHTIDGVESIDNCQLTLTAGAKDQGVVRRSSALNFECGFTPATWHNVAGLIEPFVHGASGYQWLANWPSAAALLISLDGRW
jgi:hypothetical protein